MSIRVMDWYWQNSDQDGSRLLILLALADWANEEGECFPGTTSLGKKARIARTTLKNALADFEKSGKVGIVANAGVEYNGGRTNRYYLNEYRQNRTIDGKPAPLPAITTTTLTSRKTKPASLKDKLTPVMRVTPGHAGDIPPGHTDDHPPGHASDPKPSLNPSSKPSLKDIAPATQGAVSTTAKKTPVPAQIINPIKDALVKAFGWEWKSMSKSEIGLVQSAARELALAQVEPEQVILLYQYCVNAGWKGFKPKALCGIVSDVLRKSTSNGAQNHYSSAPAYAAHLPAQLDPLD